MITLGKRGDDWARKSAQGFLFVRLLLALAVVSSSLSHQTILLSQKHDITIPRLFDEYANRYAERPGGYTRIHFHGNRLGDNAPHAIIELVDGPQDLRFQMTASASIRALKDPSPLFQTTVSACTRVVRAHGAHPPFERLRENIQRRGTMPVLLAPGNLTRNRRRRTVSK